MELDFANTAEQRCEIPQRQKIHFDEVMTPPDERRLQPDKRFPTLRSQTPDWIRCVRREAIKGASRI
jgi:hypothetical protein